MTDASNTILLARQPIFDIDLNTYAYELLFRPAETIHQEDFDGDKATSQVMLNAFTELPIEQLLEGKLAFVNFTRNLILNPPTLGNKNLVIEVLENIHFDEEMLASIKKLKKRGYTIALDDFIYNESLDSAVQLADIIKVDVLVHSQEELKNQVQALTKFKAKLLAEKVEDHAMFEYCKELGFDYFQGFFLSKPQIIKGRKTTENKQSVLQLISKLQDTEIAINEIAETIAIDAVLSFKLLKLINSSLFTFARKIESINQAVAILGLEKVRSWATLLILASSDDKPKSLAASTIVRARFCQLLGETMADENNSGASFFTVGLMSSLDAFLNIKMEELLAELSLTTAINEAILEHKGNFGLALQSVILYEHADWDNIDWDALKHFELDAETMEQHYFDSISWSQELLSQVS